MASGYLGGHLDTNCVQKNLLRPLNIKITRNLFQIGQN